ncbi:MAG: 4-hydroxyphenylpyruvate dioxygenase [Leptolyngbyaceae cyanobacterium CSU_1_3]|nr:4-hydroxyphenylpyruvate dioxygenase [Leptolyngbyaceae cyanobacterium CSU_1_3]
MKIDHVHFYVRDAIASRNWFVSKMGFQAMGSEGDRHTQTEVVAQGSICFRLSSPTSASGPVFEFLQQHPPGVVDVAFRVRDVAAVIERAIAQGATVLQPIRQSASGTSAQIAAWGTLHHTLLEQFSDLRPCTPDPAVTEIDHVVLNVAVGELEKAAAWYETVFEFQPQQRFAIQTARSGLCSRVMQHPQSSVRLPINEPTSDSSQIQEFLELNRGAGIQHIALHTPDIVKAIARFRKLGLSFLQVPLSYYTQLRQRPNRMLSETKFRQIQAQELLVDWPPDQPEGILLQTFTQPIFECPTFFFEVIERQSYRVDDRLLQAQGFGEGNFRALFEAMEQEQLKRAVAIATLID